MFTSDAGEKLSNRSHSWSELVFKHWKHLKLQKQEGTNKWDSPTETRNSLLAKPEEHRLIYVASKIFLDVQLPFVALATAQADWIAIPRAWALPRAWDHLPLCSWHCRSPAKNARAAHDHPEVLLWSGSDHGGFGRLARVHSPEWF